MMEHTQLFGDEDGVVTSTVFLRCRPCAEKYLVAEPQAGCSIICEHCGEVLWPEREKTNP